MEINLGFYSHVNTKPKATLACLKSVRKFYPNNKVVLSCDGAYNYSRLCKRYNAKYFHNDVMLGYPSQPFGYRKEKALEWLDRMHRAVLQMDDTNYFVMLEDDVLINNLITLSPGCEMSGQPLLYKDQVPLMPEPLFDIIENFSGVRPKTNFYNCGGGSIFKTNTFLYNYDRIRTFLWNNMDHIQDNIYPTLGWMDCLMCVFFYLCGKELHENEFLYNNWPLVKPFDPSVLSSDVQIIHNFKDYYD